MTRHKFTLGAVSLAFALSAVPAFAAGQAGSRPSGGSPSSGTAAPRGGGSDGGGSSTATSTASSTPSSSSSSGSATGTSSGSSTTYAAPRPSYGRDSGVERAPQRPSAGERRGGEARPTGERAVPRGTASGDSGRATPGGDNRMSEPERRAVPAYSRPRDGRTPIGTAGARTTPIPDNGRYGYFYNPSYGGYYYDPFGYYGYYNYGYYGARSSFWWPGYGMGLSYFYDPFYDPFWYGGGAGYGGAYGGGYPGYYGGYSGYSRSYRDVGAVRLKVKPRDAQVLVDGYFVGTVDDFDGVLQKLNIDSGSHRIELRAPGFAPVQFEVLITPGETVTYKGDLRRTQ